MTTICGDCPTLEDAHIHGYPVVGLAENVIPNLIEQICEHILNWNRQGISFLIFEHNRDVIMSWCDLVWVLDQGRNIAHGTPTGI